MVDAGANGGRGNFAAARMGYGDVEDTVLFFPADSAKGAGTWVLMYLKLDL